MLCFGRASRWVQTCIVRVPCITDTFTGISQDRRVCLRAVSPSRWGARALSYLCVCVCVLDESSLGALALCVLFGFVCCF